MQRSDTTQQLRFELPYPEAAVFDFSNPDGIRIDLPADTHWQVHRHWHYKTIDTRSITCIDGFVSAFVGKRDGIDGIYRSKHAFESPGSTIFMETDDSLSWMKGTIDLNERVPLTVIIVANPTLHRNICSAILDKNLYPRLRSTPLWFKALWKLSSGSRQQCLLDFILRLQLKMIYYEHDYHFSYGFIPFTWPYGFPWGDNIPDRPKRMEHRSMLLISHVYEPICKSNQETWVVKFKGGGLQSRLSPLVPSRCGMAWKVQLTSFLDYWIGRLLFGMKGRYREYTSAK